MAQSIYNWQHWRSSLSFAHTLWLKWQWGMKVGFVFTYIILSQIQTIFCTLGKESGSDIVKKAIIVCAHYSSKLSSAPFFGCFAGYMYELKFRPCLANPDFCLHEQTALRVLCTNSVSCVMWAATCHLTCTWYSDEVDSWLSWAQARSVPLC